MVIKKSNCMRDKQLKLRSLLDIIHVIKRYLAKPTQWRNGIKRVSESMIQRKGPMHEMTNSQSLSLRNLNVISTWTCPRNYNFPFGGEWIQHIQEKYVIQSLSMVISKHEEPHEASMELITC